VAVWFRVFAPANTPQSVVDRLGLFLREIIGTPDVRDRLLQVGLEPVGGTQAEFTQTIRDEMQLWSRVVEKVGIKPVD